VIILEREIRRLISDSIERHDAPGVRVRELISSLLDGSSHRLSEAADSKLQPGATLGTSPTAVIGTGVSHSSDADEPRESYSGPLVQGSGENMYIGDPNEGLSPPGFWYNLIDDLNIFMETNYPDLGLNAESNGITRTLYESACPDNPARAAGSKHGCGLALDIKLHTKYGAYTSISQNNKLAGDGKFVSLMREFTSYQASNDVEWGGDFGGGYGDRVVGRGITEFHHFEIASGRMPRYFEPFKNEIPLTGYDGSYTSLTSIGELQSLYLAILGLQSCGASLVAESKIREIIRRQIYISEKLDPGATLKGTTSIGATSSTSSRRGRGDSAAAGSTSSGESKDTIGGHKIIRFGDGNNVNLLYFFPGIGAGGTQDSVLSYITIPDVTSSNNVVIVLANKNDSRWASLKRAANKYVKDNELTVHSKMLGGWSGGAYGLARTADKDTFNRIVYADPTPTQGLLNMSKEDHRGARIFYNPQTWDDMYPNKGVGDSLKKLATQMGQNTGRPDGTGGNHVEILKTSLNWILN
jgi:hypothetical protein